MDRSFRSVLILLVGIALLAGAGATHAILLETRLWSAVLAAAGLGLSAWSLYALRTELASMVRQRRGEIALYTLCAVGVLAAVAFLTARVPVRVDMSTAGVFSLSQQTVQMLKRLEKPVHIT